MEESIANKPVRTGLDDGIVGMCSQRKLREILPVFGRNHVPVIVKTSHVIRTIIGTVCILVVDRGVGVGELEVAWADPDRGRAVIADDRSLLDEGGLQLRHGQRGDAATTRS